MANNDSGNGHDPWKRDDDGPTDIDQIVKDWQNKFGSILGGGGGKASGAGSGGGSVALIAMLVIAWLLTGFYRVDAAERGVVQRFGEHVYPGKGDASESDSELTSAEDHRTTGPGLRWHLPFPIETVDVINVQEINDFNYSEQMLTADEWYVFIDVAVQYRRTDPVKYSFEVEDPEQTLQDVTESALRGVVGTSTLASLIGERREEIPARTIEELQETLVSYGAGITVTSINIEKVDYPTNVEEAVADTQRARNDRERYMLEATSYANDVVPRARGQAQRVLQDAEAYRERVIADAQGEASRFEALLTEYQKAPRVTRDRLYLDAVESVYSGANKVIIDSEGSGNLLYLPIDQMMQRAGVKMPDMSSDRGPDISSSSSERTPAASSNRDRRTRQ